jgi:hypothetical protein
MYFLNIVIRIQLSKLIFQYSTNILAYFVNSVIDLNNIIIHIPHIMKAILLHIHHNIINQALMNSSNSHILIISEKDLALITMEYAIFLNPLRIAQRKCKICFW